MMKFNLMLLLFLCFFNPSFGKIQQFTDKDVISFENFEDFFLKSISSPDYYVISKKNFKHLKLILKSLEDSLYSANHANKINNQLIQDSLLLTKNTNDSLNQLVVTNALRTKQTETSFRNNLNIIRISILLISGLSVFLGYSYLKIKERYIVDLESLKDIEKQFYNYKNNVIERERKMMRQIIDLENKINNLK